jgi:hypothetical protein
MPILRIASLADMLPVMIPVSALLATEPSESKAAAVACVAAFCCAHSSHMAAISSDGTDLQFAHERPQPQIFFEDKAQRH